MLRVAPKTGPRGYRYALETVSAPHTRGKIVRIPDTPDFACCIRVQLTAEPFEGYEFWKWTGDVLSEENPLEVIMNDHKVVLAHFRRG